MEQEDTRENTKLLVNEDGKDKDKKTWLPHLIGVVLSFTSAASLTAALAFVQVSVVYTMLDHSIYPWGIYDGFTLLGSKFQLYRYF